MAQAGFGPCCNKCDFTSCSVGGLKRHQIACSKYQVSSSSCRILERQTPTNGGNAPVQASNSSEVLPNSTVIGGDNLLVAEFSPMHDVDVDEGGANIMAAGDDDHADATTQLLPALVQAQSTPPTLTDLTTLRPLKLCPRQTAAIVVTSDEQDPLYAKLVQEAALAVGGDGNGVNLDYVLRCRQADEAACSKTPMRPSDQELREVEFRGLCIKHRLSNRAADDFVRFHNDYSEKSDMRQTAATARECQKDYTVPGEQISGIVCVRCF